MKNLLSRVPAPWRLILGVAVMFVVVAVGATSRQSTASAATVACDPATNHCYEAVQGSLTWSAAKAAAKAKTYNGFPGHLVTITSSAETAFLVANNLTPYAYWIGASQPIGETSPAANWSWVTGEPFAYTNWAAGEPNDFWNFLFGPASEQYMQFWYTPVGKWNDIYPTGGAGFVVEYERPTNADQCKKGGWQQYVVFKNQGDCVSWVSTNGKNEPGKNVR